MRKQKFGIYATTDGHIYHVGKDHETRNGKPYNSKYGNRIYKEISGHTNIELYAHLSKVFVEPHQFVKAGDLIGIMGNTGCTQQLLIDDWTMELIRVENYTLYAWIIDMQCTDDGVIIIYDDMRENEDMMDLLNDYLIKHLHYSLFPDSSHLSGRYAIDPRPLLKSCVPPCNTKQSVGGKWNEVNTKYWKTMHMGVDFSGRVENLVENVTEFRESIE